MARAAQAGRGLPTVAQEEAGGLTAARELPVLCLRGWHRRLRLCTGSCWQLEGRAAVGEAGQRGVEAGQGGGVLRWVGARAGAGERWGRLVLVQVLLLQKQKLRWQWMVGWHRSWLCIKHPVPVTPTGQLLHARRSPPAKHLCSPRSAMQLRLPTTATASMQSLSRQQRHYA